MKKAALYILLLSYTTVMLKPVAPYVSDLVAHVFYYSQHKATVHYENGKLHVHKEIVDNAKKDESAKDNPSSKKENSANDHIIFLKNDDHLEPVAVITHTDLPPTSLRCNNLRGDHPPPKV